MIIVITVICWMPRKNIEGMNFSGILPTWYVKHVFVSEASAVQGTKQNKNESKQTITEEKSERERKIGIFLRCAMAPRRCVCINKINSNGRRQEKKACRKGDRENTYNSPATLEANKAWNKYLSSGIACVVSQYLIDFSKLFSIEAFINRCLFERNVTRCFSHFSFFPSHFCALLTAIAGFVYGK